MTTVKNIVAATKDAARKTGAQTKDLAQAVAATAENAVVAAGEAVSDGWIATKVKAHFVDVRLLTDADIAVESHDHVVTLKGTASSSAAKARAESLAEGIQGIQGVTCVVNQVAVVPAATVKAGAR